jgi:hypothetical protein
MARTRDPLTKDLFAWEPPQVAVGYGAEVMGRGALENKIARLVARALADAREVYGLQRVDVAKRMAAYLGRPVSVDMLNKWSSEAAEGHRIALDAFIALIDATKSVKLTGFVPGEFGLTVIEDEYAELIEDQLLAEHEEEIRARRNALQARRRGRR